MPNLTGRSRSGVYRGTDSRSTTGPFHTNPAGVDAIAQLIRMLRFGNFERDPRHIEARFPLDASLECFPVELTGKTEIEKGAGAFVDIDYGYSSKFGIYDWREVIIKERDQWEDFKFNRASGKPYRRIGEYSKGTGAIEVHFTNRNLHLSGDNVVWVWKLREPPSQKYYADAETERPDGYTHIFDIGVTNEDPALRETV